MSDLSQGNFYALELLLDLEARDKLSDMLLLEKEDPEDAEDEEERQEIIKSNNLIDKLNNLRIRWFEACLSEAFNHGQISILKERIKTFKGEE